MSGATAPVLPLVQTIAGKACHTTASPSTENVSPAATSMLARLQVSAPDISSPVASTSQVSSRATHIQLTGAANIADKERLSVLLAASVTSPPQVKLGNQSCSDLLDGKPATQGQARPSLCTPAFAPQSGDRAQHAQHGTVTLYPSRIEKPPYVQQENSSANGADIDDDDVSNAFDLLDAMTAPAELSRQSMPQHSRPQHRQTSVRSVASPFPAAAAHTSASAGHLPSAQSATFSRDSQFVRNRTHSSTRPEASHRRLWVPPSEQAPMPVAATPVKIMKHPSISSTQHAHASASDSHAAGDSASVFSQTSSVQPSLETPVNKALVRLSAEPQASDTPTARNVAPEVCPAGSQSPVDDVMMESKVSYLMTRVAGLSSAAAFLALQV